MNGLEVPQELKTDIENNQIEIQNAIISHYELYERSQVDANNDDIKKEMRSIQEHIMALGVEQQKLLHVLRSEYTTIQKDERTKAVKSAIEERRSNLSNAINRARKQNISTSRPSSTSTLSSDDSDGRHSTNASPEPIIQPVLPHDVTQEKFFGFLRLVTHEVFKEMQKKRAERKRRSTANPQFLYGKGWDLYTQPKRKRTTFLARPISPPNTRQATRKRQERQSPPSPAGSSTAGPSRSPPAQQTNGNSAAVKPTDNSLVNDNTKSLYTSFTNLPNLPSGLIIERVSSSGSSSPDSKMCIVCKQPGVLSTCDTCSNAFHISCHNRPLTQTPRQCPRCIGKDSKRTIGALNVPSGMSVSYVTSADISVKLEEKEQLLEAKKNLTAELTQLQNRHSELTISLKNQKTEQEELLKDQRATEARVAQIIEFIEHFKKPMDKTDDESSP